MKKTSIILGASACILAIAGAFTTKGSSKVVSNPAWTINGTQEFSTDCPTIGGVQCTLNGNTLFTAPGAGHTTYVTAVGK